MKYNGLTSAGSIYQAKCAANNIPVKFAKVKVGNGLLEETENPLNFIDVKNLKKEVGILDLTQVNEAVRLTVLLDNDGVTEGYYPREFGIYVEDDGVEVLYWYVNDGEEASYLPPQNSTPVKIKNHFNIIATSLESLIVNWTGKEFWVDEEKLTTELNKKVDKDTYEKGIETLKKGKLDTGTYEGKASDLKKDIDDISNSKYDKTGGKLTGTINIDTPAGSNFSRVDFKTDGVDKGYVGRIEDAVKAYTGFHNYISGKYLRTFDDGSTEIGADNLKFLTKEVIGALNEALRFIENNSGRKIGDLFYIQNAGTKNVGQYYFDKNTYGLYKCLNTTTSVNNDSNFVDDSNFTIGLLARDNQSKITNLNKIDYLYSGPFAGAGTFTVSNILKYNLIQLTIVISTSDTITTHEQYTVFFTPTTKFDWGNNQHALGAIAISVTAGTIYISGAGAQYVKIKEIYGIGYKGA